MNALIISLSNSNGDLDHSLPVPVFGPTPTIGSYVVIRIKELFKHNIELLKLEINWSGLPNSLTEHYTGYEPHYSLTNLSFMVNFYFGTNDTFYRINSKPVNLFNEDSSGFILPISTFQFELQNLLSLHSNPQKNHLIMDELESTLKMTLISPEVAFGHNVFPKLYSDTAIKNSRILRRIFKREISLPRQPISPIAHKIIISGK